MYYIISVYNDTGLAQFVSGPFSLEEAKEQKKHKEGFSKELGFTIKIVKEVDEVK